MIKVIILANVIILEIFAQQIFESSVLNIKNERFLNGPKLYLSRENPIYRQNKSKINVKLENSQMELVSKNSDTTSKSNDSEEDISDFYIKYILNHQAPNSQIRFIPQIKEPDPELTSKKLPIQVTNEDSLLHNFFDNLKSQKNNFHHQHTTRIPERRLVLNPSTSFENGTIILRGYMLVPQTNSFKIKNIKTEDDAPIVTRTSTIKFNGETVTSDFLRQYFNKVLKDVDDQFASRDNKFFMNSEDLINRDGFGRLDVRSGFLSNK